MDNKRISERTHITADISGLLVVDNRFSLVNISDSGALIRIPQKLSMGSLYQLKFEFLYGKKQMILKLKTKVIREQLLGIGKDSLNERIPIYEIGLSFFDTSKEDVKILKLFIAQEELKKIKNSPYTAEAI